MKNCAIFCNIITTKGKRSGRPISEKADEVLEKVQQDGHISSVDIGMELGIDHKTVFNHLWKATNRNSIYEFLMS